MAEAMRESALEGKIRDYAEATGWWHVKIMRASVRGMMDRLFINQGFHLWAEIKRPGEPPRSQQMLRAKEMRGFGATCVVWDNFEDAKKDLDYYRL